MSSRGWQIGIAVLIKKFQVCSVQYTFKTSNCTQLFNAKHNRKLRKATKTFLKIAINGETAGDKREHKKMVFNLLPCLCEVPKDSLMSFEATKFLVLKNKKTQI